MERVTTMNRLTDTINKSIEILKCLTIKQTNSNKEEIFSNYVVHMKGAFLY